jgi:hypothetical protein
MLFIHCLNFLDGSICHYQVLGFHLFMKSGCQVGKNFIVTTLALGSRPKQGFAKVWAKSEARESHFMLP